MCAYAFWGVCGWQESSALFWFWREVVPLLGSLILLVLLYPGMSIMWGCQRLGRSSLVTLMCFQHIAPPLLISHCQSMSQRKTRVKESWPFDGRSSTRLHYGEQVTGAIKSLPLRGT